MKKKEITVEVDEDILKPSEELFEKLGLELSTAINMYLHFCVLDCGIPFPLEIDIPDEETEEAIREAEDIIANPDKYPKFSSVDEMRKALGY